MQILIVVLIMKERLFMNTKIIQEALMEQLISGEMYGNGLRQKELMQVLVYME